jgi:lysophospholipid acyltransferase (LPLAT)-like uncharacterized protein
MSWWCYFMTFLRHPKRHVWLNHPKAYMKPIHTSLWFIGVRELVLGSTGEGGREAAATLEEKLKAGASTSMSPDGPAGPPRVLKKGVLHLAAATGLPILALRFYPSRAYVLKGSWDGKKFPYPFSTIKLEIQPPLYVTEATVDDSVAVLTTLLG